MEMAQRRKLRRSRTWRVRHTTCFVLLSRTGLQVAIPRLSGRRFDFHANVARVSGQDSREWARSARRRCKGIGWWRAFPRADRR